MIRPGVGCRPGGPWKSRARQGAPLRGGGSATPAGVGGPPWCGGVVPGWPGRAMPWAWLPRGPAAMVVSRTCR